MGTRRSSRFLESVSAFRFVLRMSVIENVVIDRTGFQGELVGKIMRGNGETVCNLHEKILRNGKPSLKFRNGYRRGTGNGFLWLEDENQARMGQGTFCFA